MTIDTIRTLVVVPAFNEEACIADVVADVSHAGYPCLVVDDGSVDASSERAHSAGADVVNLPINLGVGGALRTGFRFAVDHGYECVVQVDADGQHVSEHIDELLTALVERDLDMAVGSRFAKGGTHPDVLRRASSNLLARAIGAIDNGRMTDPTSGFRAIRQPLLAAFAHDFPHHYLGDTFEALYVARRRGYRIGEVPVTMRERQGGRPSANLLASGRAMVRACTVVLTGTTFDLAARPQDE